MTDSAVQKQLTVWKRYKNENGHVERLAPKSLPQDETAYQGSQSQYDWDHPFYWISQLFEEQWRAHPTYQSEL
ncbi:hypothetical protein ESCO_001954 [Escovopsis weberi]|uniref:Uncharacterized protein n=1 Tax=Escovopsis weberi TaxID=150374 RepID=A0A0M8N3P2_ESCWE|nr:hypothetical protein ESCO_001954 [Escovopsis weberi]